MLTHREVKGGVYNTLGLFYASSCYECTNVIVNLSYILLNQTVPHVFAQLVLNLYCSHRLSMTEPRLLRIEYVFVHLF